VDYLFEKLAELEHEQWAHWTKYMLNNLTPENIERWKKQAETNYFDLSGEEKEADRVWVRKAFSLISREFKVRPRATEKFIGEETSDE